MAGVPLAAFWFSGSLLAYRPGTGAVAACLKRQTELLFYGISIRNVSTLRNKSRYFQISANLLRHIENSKEIEDCGRSEQIGNQ